MKFNIRVQNSKGQMRIGEISLNQYWLLKWGSYEKGIKPHGPGDMISLADLTRFHLMEKQEDGYYKTTELGISQAKRIAEYLARPK